MKKSLSFVLVAAGFLLGASALSAIAAWSAPTSTPPGGNVDAPINAGSVAQAKTGLLALGSFQFDPAGATNIAIGSVLKAIDANGTVGWGSASSTGGFTVTGSGFIPYSQASFNLGGDWDTIFLGGQGASNGDASVGGGYIYRVAGGSTIKAVLYSGQSDYWAGSSRAGFTVTTSSQCSPNTRTDSDNLCVWLSGSDLMILTASGVQVAYMKIQNGGGTTANAGGPVFITPHTIYTSDNMTSSSVDWTTYDASSYIPASAKAVILEAAASVGDPNSYATFGSDPSTDSSAVSQILVRKTSSDPAYVLLYAGAAGGGDLPTWGQQGTSPVSDATFQYKIKNQAGYMAVRVRIIGYYQ